MYRETTVREGPWFGEGFTCPLLVLGLDVITRPFHTCTSDVLREDARLGYPLSVWWALSYVLYPIPSILEPGGLDQTIVAATYCIIQTEQ